MKRQLALLALVVGCGEVASSGNDGGSSGGSDSGSGSDSMQPGEDPLTGSLRNGCMAAFHMEEASWSGATGEVKDACGGDNAGRVVGGEGTNTVADGAHGRAGSFNGTGCIDIPNADTLHATTSLTMSAWVFPTALDNGATGANGIISKRIDSNNQSEYNLSLWLRNHAWAVIDGDAEADRLEGTATVTTQRWIQLTLVYDGTQVSAPRMRLYLNGSNDATHQETSATIPPYSSTLHIGCMPAPGMGTQQDFVGKIDEVAIWNRALSDAEIAQWYANTKP
jgi:MSHA biogenesis protein MshQ